MKTVIVILQGKMTDAEAAVWAANDCRNEMAGTVAGHLRCALTGRLIELTPYGACLLDTQGMAVREAIHAMRGAPMPAECET